MISIPLFVTDEHSCSYLDDQVARTAFVHPAMTLDTEIYSRLIEQGFRRSGNEVYRPHCQSCHACIPVRIPVAEFTPNRRQKRCLKKNQTTSVQVKPARFEHDHYSLYMRYQQHRHADSTMAQSDPDQYIHFLASDWCNTLFAELTVNGQLAGIAVIDLLDNALSAVYTFFDPDYASLSLGTFAILWQIEHAIQLNLDYLYLGYWIKDCRKMRYKDEFQPLHGLFNEQWQQIVL
jgi:leucyl-tRNA---protein transferase